MVRKKKVKKVEKKGVKIEGKIPDPNARMKEVAKATDEATNAKFGVKQEPKFKLPEGKE